MQIKYEIWLFLLFFPLVNANYNLINFIFDANIIDNKIILNNNNKSIIIQYEYYNEYKIIFNETNIYNNNLFDVVNKKMGNFNINHEMIYNISSVDENYLNVLIDVNQKSTLIISINNQIEMINNILKIDNYELIFNKLLEIEKFGNFIFINFPDKMIYNFVIKYIIDKLSY